MLVKKYGGSSLATDDMVRRAAATVAAEKAAGEPVIVVVSARGDRTNDLLNWARAAGQVLEDRETDQLMATGEIESAAMMAISLQALGVPSVSLTGAQAGISASGKHGAGTIRDIDPTRLRDLAESGVVPVVAGFQGVNSSGDVITLGRGGSDTTAVALAARLGADRCEILTDVDAVFTADPRIIASARDLPAVDASVMAEMAFTGAKILHSRAVELAAMQGVELVVRNSSPDATGEGTVIRAQEAEWGMETAGVVVAITHDIDVARVLVRCQGGRQDLAAELLALLASHAIPADLVARSGAQEDEFRMGFTIKGGDAAEARLVLSEAIEPLDGVLRIDEQVGKVSLVGMGLLNRPEYTARMLSALSAAGMTTSWVSTSQLRSSAIVPLDQVVGAVELLHQEFGLDRAGDEPVVAPAV